MTTTPSSERDAVTNAVDELIRQSLAEGVHPADLSTALTVAALRIGLQYAPNAGVAFSVVMKATSDFAVQVFAAANRCDHGRDLAAELTEGTIH
jgi:hypothetical protein